MMRRKRTIKKTAFRIALLGLALFVVLFLAKATWGLYQKNAIARESRDKAQEQFAGLEARYEDLSEDVSRLQTEYGLEEELRIKFQVSKPGEHTVVLLEAEEHKDLGEEEKSFWRAILDFLKI